MIEATVGYLTRGEGGRQEILLGKRDTTFCPGLWSGPGGKMRRRETPLGGLRRETREEIGVVINRDSARHVSTIDFHRPHHTGYRVYFFHVYSWEGEPRPVEGFSELRWFDFNNLPYREMNADIKIWFPMTLDRSVSGKLLLARIDYADSEMKVVRKTRFRLR